MVESKSPSTLWDHCIELQAHIRSNTALDVYELEGQVPETIMSGQTADISPFVEFKWYDWVKYWDGHGASYPEPKEALGRWLGPAKDIGPAMTAKILKPNGQVVYGSTYRGLTEDEKADPSEKALRDAFDKAIAERMGTPLTESELEELDPDALTPVFENYKDVEQNQLEAGKEEVTPEEADNYIGAEVTLPHQGDMKAGKVTRRVRSEDGTLIGRENPNPLLDTRQYQVEFPDGAVNEFTANVIAQNMISQCDSEGNQFRLIREIVGHRKNDRAVAPADRYFVKGGRQYLRKTTAGWDLCVEWRDGTTSWERLSGLKEAYPVEVSEYATSQGIDHEPAFAWWVHYVLKKRDRIIAAVNKRYHKRSHKFGIELPKTVKRALEIDREKGNTLWREAIAKEMKAVKIAFKILDDGQQPPIGYQYMQCHMVFDIKLDGFRRKARLVAGGHVLDPPAVLTYASVVTRESVRIALTVAALNDLQVRTSDVMNAYLTAPCEERYGQHSDPNSGPMKVRKP